MIWSSYEYTQACKTVFCHVRSLCKLDRENEHLIAQSKREKDLEQAQLATEWRKQQACSLKQMTGHQVCKLTTAQE